MGLLWLFSVGVAFWWGNQSRPLQNVDPKDAAALVDSQREVENVRRQLAILERSEQIAKVASNELQQNLRDRQEEIAGLRADLAFYSRLTGGNTKRESLTAHSIHLRSVANSPAFNFTVTLTQNLKKGQIVSGRVRINVEGIQNQKLVTLQWPDLSQEKESEGVGFSFKYFQRVQGTLLLPSDFIPNKIRIIAEMRGDNSPIEQEFAWADALHNEESLDVQ